MGIIDKLTQRRRERAALAEILRLNAPRMLGLTLEVADAQQAPSSAFVALLDGTTSPPEILVVRREVARERFAEFKLGALDAVPERGITYVAGLGHAVEAGVLDG